MSLLPGLTTERLRAMGYKGPFHYWFAPATSKPKEPMTFYYTHEGKP